MTTNHTTDIDAIRSLVGEENADELHPIFNLALIATDELERLRAEVAEQCRLNGMGAERELRLMAQLDELRAEREAMASRDHNEAVAWLVTSKHGLVRACWTTKPDDVQIAVAAADGDTITPLFAIAEVAAIRAKQAERKGGQTRANA